MFLGSTQPPPNPRSRELIT
uniref:Chaperone protein dnaJ 10 isoform X2 n=1 Tax=Rhizophora mucronata TaxID=61149 RepID=A0A2P2KE44_RHIMU